MDDDGDGGYSDQEGEDADHFAVGEEPPDEEEVEVLTNRIAVESTALAADVFFYKDGTPLEDSVSYPKPPVGFQPAAPKVDKGEPPVFGEVDNPGDWDCYYYRPKFDKKAAGGQYTHHQLPSGCTPVPGEKDEPTREYKDWRFHYQGWTAEENQMDDDDGTN